MKNVNDYIQEIEKNLESKDCEIVITGASEFGKLSDCITDTIHDIADSETDIMTGNLLDWLSNDNDSFYYIEESVCALGFPGSAREFDFVRLLQQGQYYQNEQKLYENQSDFCKLWLLYYLKDNRNITELTDSQYDIIEDIFAEESRDYETFQDYLNEYETRNKGGE